MDIMEHKCGWLKSSIEYNEDFKLDWHDPDELTDGYQLKWVGKDYARLQAGTKTETVIIPDEKHNEKENNKNSQNLFFTGDNLDVLKHLQNAYSNSIKMIYIDPPYNTGKEFAYSDKFEFSDKQLRNMLGLSDEEIRRLHTINGRSSHSAWLTFMYPRLKIARKLLTEDGVIFISIDDNEQANLKLLCDEIFGEANFISLLSIENNPKGRKNSNFIAVSNEYNLIYSKNKDKSYFVENIPKNIKDLVKDENGRYIHNSGKRVLVGENEFNAFVTDFESDKHYSVYYNIKRDDIIIKQEKELYQDEPLLSKNGYKRYISYNRGKFVENTYTKSKFLELYENNALDFKEDKIYEKNFSTTKRLKSCIVNEKYKAIINEAEAIFEIDIKTTSANTYLKTLFQVEENLFQASKNKGLINLFLTLFEEKNYAVLDFFAGSATTADAVMQLNAEDGGNRKYIMVQLPEPVKNNLSAKEAGFNTIDEIARKRIELAAEKIKKETAAVIDYGYKHYYVKNVDARTIDKIVEFDANENKLIPEDMVSEFNSEKADGEKVILTTWLIDDGYKLSQEIETKFIDGYKSYYVDNSVLYLIERGWTSNHTKTLLNMIGSREMNVNTIVLYGYSFTLESLRELEINTRTNLDNNVRIEKRY